MNISVFGGSQPRPGEPAYEEARRLGYLLGSAGHTLLTGGYIGTMEAVSRGAAEAGAHVIGVTCEEIERFRPGGHNPWVMEERRYVTLRERLGALIDGCQAAIALPGGVGTLTEIALFWNHLVIRAMEPKPLILVGAGWKTTFDVFFQQLGNYMNSHDRDLLSFEADVDTAVNHLSVYGRVQ
jgi:uncharacterized protein (TIGR00725 family)